MHVKWAGRPAVGDLARGGLRPSRRARSPERPRRPAAAAQRDREPALRFISDRFEPVDGRIALDSGDQPTTVVRKRR